MQAQEFGSTAALVMNRQVATYAWSSKGTRIFRAVFWIVAAAVVSLFIATAALTSPYELRIRHPGVVTLVSVAGTREFAVADMVGIVRHELRGDRRLDHLDVVLRGGSVRLPGREDIFQRLLALNPAVRVEARAYDPPSGP